MQRGPEFRCVWTAGPQARRSRRAARRARPPQASERSTLCRFSARTSCSRRSTRGRRGAARRRRSSPTSSSSPRSRARSPRRASLRAAATPYGFSSLVPWLTAPFWWLEPVASAYEAIKTVQAFVMAAAIFPAFALARMVVSPRRGRYFAAVGDDRRAGAVLRPDPRRGAVGVSRRDARALAHRARDRSAHPLDAGARRRRVRARHAVRSQLAALSARSPSACSSLVWRREPMRRWRATWTTLGLGRAASCSAIGAADRARRVPRPSVERVAGRDDGLEGPDGRVRQLGGRSVRDRARGAARDRAARGARLPAPRSERGPACARSSSSPAAQS